MNPDLVALVKLVHSVVAEDDERHNAVAHAMRNKSYLTVGCAVCGATDIPAIGHCDTCPGTLENP